MFRKLHWIMMILLALGLMACGQGKQSAIEGMLVDGSDKPLAGVTVKASQTKPVKGYEHIEAVTNADGTFRLKGLFPSSQYVIKPYSDVWTTEASILVDSAPEGRTTALGSPITVRFTITSDGVITDSQTGLEWVVGPDVNTDFHTATQWVAEWTAAGGNWRMPTRQELLTLYEPGADDLNIDPIFKISGALVWAERVRISLLAFAVDFRDGSIHWNARKMSDDSRVLGVRVRY